MVNFTTMKLTKDEYEAVYRLQEIEKIEYGKADEFCSEGDLIGNDIGPNETMILIVFEDGTLAHFTEGWKITFY